MVGGVRASWLQRNCSLDDLAGLAIDEYEAEILRPLTQPAEDMSPMLSVVGLSARIAIDQSIFQCVIDEDGEFARGRRDGFGFADAEREPAGERAEGNPRVQPTAAGAIMSLRG